MADAGGDQSREAGRKQSSAEKLYRAHKRCCNERCRALLALAEKHCKKCNTTQVERKSLPTFSGSGDDDAEGGKRSRKRKSSDVSSSSEDRAAGDSDPADSEAEEAEAHATAAGAARAGSEAELTYIAQATGYAIQQERETLDREPFDSAAGPDKPMMELQAGSAVYYQASIIRESRTEIRVLFPETKKMRERREWVDKRSSRIWRGRMESRYWRYIKGSDGGWEPKSVGEGAAGGSFRRKGSAARSRGSAGRSRGTKQSTEDGTESEKRRRTAAAMDTAASPQPKASRQQLGMRRRQLADASSASSDAAGSDGERPASGAAAAAGERRPRFCEVADPLEAWFKVHYGLLRAAACLGTGLTPPSAETGKASAARRRSGTAQPRRRVRPLAGPQRNREQRQQERRAAQPPSEAASSEDEGAAAIPSPRSGGNAAPAKAGRELKRLQIWAWERRRGSDSSDDDEDVSGDGEAGSHDSAEEGSQSGGRHKAAPAAARQDAAHQQQQNAQQQPKAPVKDGTAPRTSADVQQPAGADAAQAALPGRGADGRVAPSSTEARQRPKLAVAEPKHPQQARPRAPPRPLAVLEECDVFGKLPAPARKQPSGAASLPPSPRAAGGAEAGPGSGRQGPAAAGGQLQLPKQPSDPPVKAPAAAPAAPAALVNGADVSPRAQDAPAAAPPSSATGDQTAQPPLSPQKHGLAKGSGAGVADAAAASEPTPESGQQQAREVSGEGPAKRQNVQGEDAGAAPAKGVTGSGTHLAGQAGT